MQIEEKNERKLHKILNSQKSLSIIYLLLLDHIFKACLQLFLDSSLNHESQLSYLLIFLNVSRTKDYIGRSRILGCR